MYYILGEIIFQPYSQHLYSFPFPNTHSRDCRCLVFSLFLSRSLSFFLSRIRFVDSIQFHSNRILGFSCFDHSRGDSLGFALGFPRLRRSETGSFPWREISLYNSNMFWRMAGLSTASPVSPRFRFAFFVRNEIIVICVDCACFFFHVWLLRKCRKLNL